ncbi:hypothetical protein LV89_01827 [Arcicella aurantiaca]|uniref:Uncharacterized protein n=1 Tax=Arcicella aurantiaca TaxID=591202 RepID=A0A316ECB6_9BACT|nr:hypothetical protein [Arcicella aurantiaca]PWK27015.1 hypothetical protein LV89_01827 [Arcicella aurantiaca]
MNTNFESEEAEAKAQIEQQQQRLKELADLKAAAKQKKIDQQIEERNDLFDNAKRFRAEAMTEVGKGNIDSAKILREFADDAEKQAKEMFIEGDLPKIVEESQSEVFGEGMSLKKVMLLLTCVLTALYFLTGYINHLVELGEKSISISLGAEWIHAIQTTQFWSLCWLVSIGMLRLNFRSISRFVNPKDDPHFDLTTKLFTECTPQFQITVSLGLLLSMVFSWCLIYLHSPVANAG